MLTQAARLKVKVKQHADAIQILPEMDLNAVL